MNNLKGFSAVSEKEMMDVNGGGALLLFAGVALGCVLLSGCKGCATTKNYYDEQEAQDEHDRPRPTVVDE